VMRRSGDRQKKTPKKDPLMDALIIPMCWDRSMPRPFPCQIRGHLAAKAKEKAESSRRQACCQSEMTRNAPSQSQFAFISLSLGRNFCPWG
jgi:hypothetical protein